MLDEHGSSWKRPLALLVLAGAVLAAFSGVIRRRYLAREFPVEVLRDLTRPFSGRRWADESDAGEEPPPRTGKVILIVPALAKAGKFTDYATDWQFPGYDLSGCEIDPPSIHPDWFELDPSIRARTLDEVDTIVFCELDTAIVGYYADGPKYQHEVLIDSYAHVRKCRMKVFDRATGEFLGIHVVEGGMPKEAIGSGEAQHGEAPDVAGVVGEMPLR